MISRFRSVGGYSCVLTLLAATACSTSTPSVPSGTSSVGGSSASSAPPADGSALISVQATGSIFAPRPVSPANNLIVRFQDQPVTLIVQNAIVTKPGDTTYTFEVAADAAFVSKVQVKDGIAQGGGAATSVQLDALAPSRDYYWHVRAQGAGTVGVFSAPFKFTMGAAIVIAAPVPIGPLNGVTVNTRRPAFRVANAARTGPAGAITYKFEISTVPTFTSLLMSGVNVEGVNETGFIPTADLPPSTSLYWRATAMDAANGVSSSPSAVQNFLVADPSQAEQLAAQIGQTLWPGAQPTGTVGHATMGEAGQFGVGWQVQTLYYYPGNVTFQSPDIEMLRIFDLLDRGFDPPSAAAWMNQNGYPTQALWYPPPEKAVIGLRYVYIAARGKVSVNGIWDIVVRVE
jgi:hypothetical protein